MKLFLLLFVFLLIGLAILLSFHYWNPKLFSSTSKPELTTKFSLKDAPSESFKGTIATMSGSVNWLSRTANSSVGLKTPRILQQGEEISTGSNGNAVINIQNDASLRLFPNSHVNIIQLLPQNFVFVQDKGQIRYENTIQVPISVRSLDLITLIVKGIVTVSVDPIQKSVTVAVTQGTIKEGYEDLQNTSNVVTVNPGQTFLFDETNKIGTVQ